MKHFAAVFSVFFGFFLITAAYTLWNHSALLPALVMERVWLSYLPLLSFWAAFIYGRHYQTSGGGIFLAFCLVGLPTLFSYYQNLPWGYFFFAPLPLLLAAAAAICGEAIGKLRQNALKMRQKKESDNEEAVKTTNK